MSPIHHSDLTGTDLAQSTHTVHISVSVKIYRGIGSISWIDAPSRAEPARGLRVYILFHGYKLHVAGQVHCAMVNYCCVVRSIMHLK